MKAGHPLKPADPSLRHAPAPPARPARREFIRRAALPAICTALAPGLSLLVAPSAAAAGAPGIAQGRAGYGNLLILVELKGGNDGLNTLVPFADPAYAALRPRLAQRREGLIHLNEREGLHGSLAALQPLWQSGELAVVRGVGYPRPNLSHFRSIEIWDTASASEEYLPQGWVARAFAARAVPREFAAAGVVVGNVESGPLGGVGGLSGLSGPGGLGGAGVSGGLAGTDEEGMAGGATQSAAGGGRVITLANTEQFLRQARSLNAGPVMRARGSRALEHILKVEADIVQAAGALAGGEMTRTAAPEGAFGNAVRTAAQVLAARGPVAAMRLSLNGFDTHQNQAGTHASLLQQLGDGLAALKAALVAQNRWDSTLILTYAEFGRRAQENGSAGTDHGTAGVHFALGGRVKGGLYGDAPRLDRLEDGNLVHTVDFRSLYATALQRWWGIEPAVLLGGRFPQLDLIRS
jgi:uncharacterized protein (DUF1501 family)